MPTGAESSQEAFQNLETLRPSTVWSEAREGKRGPRLSVGIEHCMSELRRVNKRLTKLLSKRDDLLLLITQCTSKDQKRKKKRETKEGTKNS